MTNKNARRRANRRGLNSRNTDDHNMWAGPLMTRSPFKVMLEEEKRASRPTIEQLHSRSTSMDPWWLVPVVMHVSMKIAALTPSGPNMEGMSDSEGEDALALWNHPSKQRDRFITARVMLCMQRRCHVGEIRAMVAVQRWWNSCIGISYCALPDIDSMSSDQLIAEIFSDNTRMMRLELKKTTPWVGRLFFQGAQKLSGVSGWGVSSGVLRNLLLFLLLLLHLLLLRHHPSNTLTCR